MNARAHRCVTVPPTSYLVERVPHDVPELDAEQGCGTTSTQVPRDTTEGSDTNVPDGARSSSRLRDNGLSGRSYKECTILPEDTVLAHTTSAKELILPELEASLDAPMSRAYAPSVDAIELHNNISCAAYALSVDAVELDNNIHHTDTMSFLDIISPDSASIMMSSMDNITLDSASITMSSMDIMSPDSASITMSSVDNISLDSTSNTTDAVSSTSTLEIAGMLMPNNTDSMSTTLTVETPYLPSNNMLISRHMFSIDVSSYIKSYSSTHAELFALLLSESKYNNYWNAVKYNEPPLHVIRTLIMIPRRAWLHFVHGGYIPSGMDMYLSLHEELSALPRFYAS